MASKNKQGNEKRETVADILAEYRNDADAMDRGWLYRPTTEYVRRLLDRIEAAWKREARAIATEHAVLPAVCITKPSGDAAAIRKALLEIETVAGEAVENGTMELPQYSKIVDIAESALSAPPRQCDVGTAEEQAERYHAKGEVYHTLTLTNALEWAQMPYEAEGAGE